MKTKLMVLVLIAFAITGCNNSARITALEARVTQLETDHTATRAKLQALLQWINRKDTPPDVGLYEWVVKIHAKVYTGTTDPNPPSAPPPPF